MNNDILVTREVTKKSLLTVTHALFFISMLGLKLIHVSEWDPRLQEWYPHFMQAVVLCHLQNIGRVAKHISLTQLIKKNGVACVWKVWRIFREYDTFGWYYSFLTHSGQGKMRQNGYHFATTFSNAFSSIKIIIYLSKFFWTLFWRIQLTVH